MLARSSASSSSPRSSDAGSGSGSPLGQAELRPDLLLEQAQSARRALLLDGELRAFASELGEAFACLREALLELAPRAFRGECAFACELCRSPGLARFRG